MNVLLLVIGGLPVRHVGRALTPAITALAADGGWAPAGGVAVLPSCTYPNHATFATGAGPDRHGIWANWVPDNGRVRAAAEVGPCGQTLFQACRSAGRSSVGVFGDQHLVGVMAARAADSHWPPDGVLPDGTATDAFGYAADNATLVELLRAATLAPDLLVGQLNGPDTAAHVHGPDSEHAAEQYRATDAAVAILCEALAPRWEDWVVVVVSDHDQETLTVDEPVDLFAAVERAGPGLQVVPEGGAALVFGPDPDDGRWLAEVVGVAGSMPLAADIRLAWTVPGRFVGHRRSGFRGVHGGPGQLAQVAVCGGGHPAVRSLAATLARRRPYAADWAVTIAELLGLRLDGATGRSLLA